MQDDWKIDNICRDNYLVGSCNGLVCMFTSDFKLCVLNPCTKELITLENMDFPVFQKYWMLHRIPYLNGFGYDPSSDDYKVLVSQPLRNLIRLYLLSLNSNVCKVVGDFHITIAYNSAGILCNGALYWLMADQNMNPVQHILSFHLSKDEFKEIPIPADHKCKVTDRTRLGIVEECLCIFDESSCDQPKWAMKNYNDTQS
uniref:F-box/kelch-repeat protein At3g23880-like n=1 Tax=Erigeron canadensis TaxID=72917 RepID=UPI001CB8AEF0|nr:F-box/kelch-repeat protein At3g23880-like [Erigeron canadensis]